MWRGRPCVPDCTCYHHLPGLHQNSLPWFVRITCWIKPTMSSSSSFKWSKTSLGHLGSVQIHFTASKVWIFATETHHDQLAWRFLASTTQKYNPKCCQPQLLLRDFEWLNWICSEGFLEISFSYFSFVAFSYFSKGNWIWLTQIIRAYPGHNPPTFSCPCLSWKGGLREQVCVYRVQRTWKMTQFRIRKFKTDTDTLSDTKNFRNRYRYFFRYQNFPKPIPIP